MPSQAPSSIHKLQIIYRKHVYLPKTKFLYLVLKHFNIYLYNIIRAVTLALLPRYLHLVILRFACGHVPAIFLFAVFPNRLGSLKAVGMFGQHCKKIGTTTATINIQSTKCMASQKHLLLIHMHIRHVALWIWRSCTSRNAAKCTVILMAC